MKWTFATKWSLHYETWVSDSVCCRFGTFYGSKTAWITAFFTAFLGLKIEIPTRSPDLFIDSPSPRDRAGNFHKWTTRQRQRRCPCASTGVGWRRRCLSSWIADSVSLSAYKVFSCVFSYILEKKIKNVALVCKANLPVLISCRKMYYQEGKIVATCILQTLCNVSQVFFFCVAKRSQRGKQSNSEHQVIGKTHTTIKVRWVGDSLIINKPTCITWELSLEKAIILYSKMYYREGNNFLQQNATCIIQALCIVSLSGFVFILFLRSHTLKTRQTNKYWTPSWGKNKLGD